MLDNLRNMGRTWIAKVLLGLLILAVAGFGLPSVFLDLNANTVARVGDQNITAREFDRYYRGALNQYASMGMSLTAQQSMMQGVPGSVLANLANDASLDMLANRLTLGASDDRVAQLVRRDPSFAGSLGNFDRGEFTAVLRQVGYTEAEYLNLQRRFAKREQLATIFDGVALPQVARDIATAYENEQRVIEYVELNPVFFTSAEDPSEDDLARFFAENQNRFRTEEIRSVRLLPLTAEALAEGIEVSEAEIEAEYERTAAQYTTVEQRTIHQIVLPGEEAVALFEQALAEGRPFEEVAAEAGLSGNVALLGTFARNQMTDQTLAATAFSLEEGDFAIIGGALGQRAIWVSDIVEGGVRPLDEVRDAIRSSLQLAAARDVLMTAYDDIEEARAAFLPIEDVAAQYGLPIYELELTRDGSALSQAATIPEPTRSTVVTQVFSASENASVTPAINLGSNRTVFFDLLDVQPVRDQTLDEVRDEAIAAWQDLQTDMELTAAAEDMVAQLDAGGDLFAIASDAGQIPQISQPFGRGGTADGSVGADIAGAAFVGGERHAGYAVAEDGTVIVFRVVDVSDGTDAPSQQLANAIGDSFENMLYASFIDGLRQDTAIRVNEATLNRLIGLE